MNNDLMNRLLRILCTLLFAGNCLAQDYPNKPVRFIAPNAPGGSSDILARTLGQKLAEAMGQPFIIDNRPGARSIVGTEVLAKSPADGYTIILSDMPHAINPSINPRVPYDPVKDFSLLQRSCCAGL